MMDGTSESVCLLHKHGYDQETLSRMTFTQFNTSNIYAKKWVNLVGEPQSSVASNRLKLNNYTEQLLIHNRCYKWFTNKVALERSESRAARLAQAAEQPRALRSAVQAMKPVGLVLPQKCVICQRGKFYTKKNHLTVEHPLVKASTMAAGESLVQSARAKGDQELIILLGSGTDCVALEVHYHRTCYRTYTRKEKDKIKGTRETESYTKTYERFCAKIIQRKVIGMQRIYKLSSLCHIFTKMVKSSEDPELSSFNATLLRRRLERDYENLIIQMPSTKRGGYIVYPVNAISHESDEDTDYLTESDSNTDTELNLSDVFLKQRPEERAVHEAHMSCIRMRQDIKSHPYSMPWPLTDKDITLDAWRTSIPASLFNFLKLIVTARGEDHDYKLAPSQERKLISICQDIVGLATNKINTPKSLSLGLVIKHLTKSKELITLLHRLGHVASYDSILAYETSLAQYQIDQNKDIPPDFQGGELIVMVWDNIDFLEETKTGAGTTHHTNGIILQAKHQTVNEQHHPSHSVSRSSRKRPFKPEITDIVPLHFHKKTGPVHLTGQLFTVNKEDLKSCAQLEFSLIMARHSSKSVPSWTGFNKLIRVDYSAPESVLSYLPVIESPPTNLDTVNHILQVSLDYADKFGLDAVVLVFDQAIYAKAQQLRFVNPILRERIVMRMGEFHTVMNYMGLIGKRFGPAGMKEMLIEAQVVASGSINGVLSGHQYNRAMHANKLLMESLYDLALTSFIESLSDEESMFANGLCNVLGSVAKDKLEFEQCCVGVQGLYEKFLVFIQKNCKKLPTFKFWWSYVEMVILCLTFVRATRESNWKLHLNSLRQMLPWFYMYNHHNYARFATLYHCEMTELPKTNPLVADTFITKRGSFTYQRGHHRPFSGIACDQAIEQTVNRHSKSAGGLVGFTLNRAAAQRWTLSHPQRSRIHGAIKDIAGFSDTYYDRHETTQTSWTKEDYLRQQLSTVIQDRVNPFSFMTEKLVNIVSGIEANLEVTSDLLSAEVSGEEKVQQFIQTRISSNEVDFFAPIKASKSKTFADCKPPGKTKAKIQCNKKLFDRLLVVSQQRKVDLQLVLTYSLGDISWSLGCSDGSILKNCKSQLAHAISVDLSDCYADPTMLRDCAVIIDAMAELQTISALPPTFGELASYVLQRLVFISKKYKAQRVDFVCDTYPVRSIKGGERERRGKSGVQRVSIYGPSQMLPVGFRAFISVGSNKEALVRFFVTHWSTAVLNTTLELYVGIDKECHLLTYADGCGVIHSTVPSLECDHEEADTRLLLHAQHATSCSPNRTTVIKCQDTDVFVLGLGVADKFAGKLVLSTGRGESARLIDLTAASRKLSPAMCQAIVALHAITGCDSVSAFYRQGKKKAYKILKEYADQLVDVFKTFGTSFNVSKDVCTKVESFVCQLYGVKETNVNIARYKVFCSPGKVSEANLPPTKDELCLHLSRAWYQTAIWRGCLSQWIKAPPPTEYGWMLRDDALIIKWMSQPPAPEKVLNVIFCRCKSGCSSHKCGCKNTGLQCTDLCQCSACTNNIEENSDGPESDSSDDE